MPILVIVESPAKCKKIEGYLGRGYKCLASFGHIRGLTDGLKGIDVQNNYSPSFKALKEKTKNIIALRKEINKSKEVILATDDDREGEAIAWHICQEFRLPVSTTKRIIFHEITKPAILKAVQNPTVVNMDMVHAQQARQVLDVLVGYKVSPTLWSNVARAKSSLSAGRCQTPALRLVYDNQKDIEASPGKKMYQTTGTFTKKDVPFMLQKNHESDDDMANFLEDSVAHNHTYSCSDVRETKKNQPTPFTTSRLQQVASNELHYSPKQTMQLCQKLYEGGYITYMRTDSTTYSVEFIENISKFIKQKYDKTYLRKDITKLALRTGDAEKETKKDTKTVKATKTTKATKSTKTKGKDDKNAQEAHEAIRPTDCTKEKPPIEDARQQKMYNLIWRNTMESCMSLCECIGVTASITAPENTIYKYSCEEITFPGWKIVGGYEKTNPIFRFLRKIKNGTVLEYSKIYAKVVLKDAKTHYTEAKLVQMLEDRGIGRPSTFSSLIDKIQERGYVKKEDVKGRKNKCIDFELIGEELGEIETMREFGNERGKLVLQQIGRIVIEFLLQNFETVFEYDYTKKMEDTLDVISKGQQEWHTLCRDCDSLLDNTLVEVKKNAKKKMIKVDDHHSYMIARYGPVLKYDNPETGKVEYKKVKKDIDMEKLERGEYSLFDIVEDTPKDNVLGKHDGKDVVLKKGRYGLYVTWGDKNISVASLRKSATVLTLLDVKPLLTGEKSGSKSVVRDLTKDISIRRGKYGDYIFYKTAQMTKPQFLKLRDFDSDYKTCKASEIMSWILATYGIE